MIVSALALPVSVGTVAQAGSLSVINGHIPSKAIARAQEIGRKSASDLVQLAVVLTPRNAAQLESQIQSFYDPTSPNYHHFLSPSDFVDSYSPTQADVDQVVSYLTAHGLKVTSSHPNRLVVDVEGPVAAIENAFQIELHEYVAADGQISFAPTSEPLISGDVSAKVGALAGLNGFAHFKPHLVKHQSNQGLLAPAVGGKSIGGKAVSCPGSINSYMTPAKIKSGYSLTTVTQTGTGETLALVELDGYTLSDIQGYASCFGITLPTIQNVLVDGFSGTPGSGANEVTLDIELMVALAPGVSQIRVYEGVNTGQGIIDVYSKVASENLANEISTSWGEAENAMTSAEMNAEYTIFQQMAAQGQSIFAAAGDNGAYDDSPNGNNTSLEVDDPGAQPYVTSVGGTLLTLNGSNAWSSETSWVASASTGTYGQGGYVASAGGGGGVSTQWGIPSWQSGLGTSGNKGSSTMRMVPDVALEADPTNGYPIYFTSSGTPGWYLYGGTSCAAPLWAAFTALVNQKRIASGMTRLGFMNPTLYSVGSGSHYSTSFHDIADGSTNLHFPATTGYDLTTGWGSFNGAGLFAQLTTGSVSAPTAPSGVSASPGSLAITVSWSTNASATSYTVYRGLSGSGPFSSVYSGSATQYADTSVSYGTTYYYYITATNGAGTSSNSATVWSSPYPVPPGAPSNLSVVAQ